MVKERKRITGSTNIDRPNHYTDQIKPKLPHFHTIKPSNQFNQTSPSFNSNSFHLSNLSNNLINDHSLSKFSATSYSESGLQLRPGWKSITQSHLSREPVVIRGELRRKSRVVRGIERTAYENDYDSSDDDDDGDHRTNNDNNSMGIDIGNHFSSSVATQTYVLPSISVNAGGEAANGYSNTNDNMSTSKILSNLLVKSNSTKNKLSSGKFTCSNTDATDIPIINQITQKLKSLELSNNKSSSRIVDNNNSIGGGDSIINNSLSQSHDSIILKQLMNHDFKKATRMDNICNLSTNQLNNIIVLQKIFDQNEMKKEAEREEENLYLSRQFLNTIDVDQQRQQQPYLTTLSAAASTGRINTATRKHHQQNEANNTTNNNIPLSSSSSTSSHAEYESFKASHHLAVSTPPHTALSISSSAASTVAAGVADCVALATLVPKPNQKSVIVVPGTSSMMDSSSSFINPPLQGQELSQPQQQQQQQSSMMSLFQYDTTVADSCNNNSNSNSRPTSKTTKVIKNTYGNNNSLDTLNSNNMEILKNTLNINDTPFGPSRIKSLQYLEQRAVALDTLLKNNNNSKNNNNNGTVNNKNTNDNQNDDIQTTSKEQQYSSDYLSMIENSTIKVNNDSKLRQSLNKSKSTTNMYTNNGNKNNDQSANNLLMTKSKSIIMRPSIFNSSSTVNINDDNEEYDDGDNNSNYYDNNNNNSSTISFHTGKKLYAQPQPYLSKYKLNTTSISNNNNNNQDDDSDNNHYQSMASLYTNGLTLAYAENNNSNNNNTSDAHRAYTAKQSLREARYARTQQTLQQLQEFNDQEELKIQILDMSRVRRKNNTMIRVETKALIDNFIAFSRVPVQGRKNVLKPNKHLSDRMWNGQGNAAVANHNHNNSNSSNNNIYDSGISGGGYDGSSGVNISPQRRSTGSSNSSSSVGGFEMTYNQSFDSSVLLFPLPSASPFAPPSPVR